MLNLLIGTVIVDSEEEKRVFDLVERLYEKKCDLIVVSYYGIPEPYCLVLLVGKKAQWLAGYAPLFEWIRLDCFTDQAWIMMLSKAEEKLSLSSYKAGHFFERWAVALEELALKLDIIFDFLEYEPEEEGSI